MAYKTKSSPLMQGFFNNTTSIAGSLVNQQQQQPQQQSIFSGGLPGLMNTPTSIAGQFVKQAQPEVKPKKEINTHLDKWKTDVANYKKDLEVKNLRNNPYDLESNFVEPYKPMANGQRNPWDKILNPTQQMNPRATGNNAVVKNVFGQEQIPGSYDRSMSPLNQMQDINPIVPPPTNSEPVPPPSTVQQAVAPTYDLSNT
jgi:hypothetical protein